MGVSVKHTLQGTVLPAMPDDIMVEVDTVKASIRYILGQGMFYYDKSLVKKYNVTNIPLKPVLPEGDPLASRMESGCNNMKNTVPFTMLKENIGSNLGLVTIMRRYYEEREMHNGGCHDYHCLNVDENIFWRVVKVQPCLYYMFF